MWARGYFSITTGSINKQDVQKYIEEQKIHHKLDDFKISALADVSIHSLNEARVLIEHFREKYNQTRSHSSSNYISLLVLIESFNVASS